MNRQRENSLQKNAANQGPADKPNRGDEQNASFDLTE